MRMSCNGCRVLRKGCSENCSIRPCLEWIKSPESQANATVFLAKFYGRAGLVNLINAGPPHLRPAIFKSLMYEACGRMVNPIYGSVGLLWSGQWQQCQKAVEAVLKGEPITPISPDNIAAAAKAPLVKGYDIRHVSKEDNSSSSTSAESTRLKPTRKRFKRAGTKPIQAAAAAAPMLMTSPGSSTSHEYSSVSHPDETTTDVSMASKETADADVDGKVNDVSGDGDGELELELTLGFGFGFGCETVQKGQHLTQTSNTSGHDLRLG